MLHMLMIDVVEAYALASLQKSLQDVSTLIALQSQAFPDSLLGLCALKYPKAKEVQLQVQPCMAT